MQDYTAPTARDRATGAKIKWVVGTAIALGGTALTVITFVLNNATPKPAPTPPQSVVVYTQPMPVPPVK